MNPLIDFDRQTNLHYDKPAQIFLIQIDCEFGVTRNDRNNIYNARGRMTTATTAAGTTQYRVNALGQRARKTNALEDVVYTYDKEGRLLAESSPAGQIQREYIYLYDTLIGVVR